MTTIDNTNYELWLLRYAEGDLSAAECAAVEAWLEGHPEAAEELALYREAPRLEKNPLSQTPALTPRSSWPVLLRWSAAAAVVVLLMLPAMRMGTMERIDVPQLVAENRQPTPVPLTHSLPEVSTPAVKAKPAAIENNIKIIESMESMKPIDSITPPPAIIEVSSLIAYAEESISEPVDTIHTLTLIAYETEDWGDRLLALNEATHESLSQSFGGRLVSHLLPDNQQLEQRVVEPLRERMDNLKNKLKQ